MNDTTSMGGGGAGRHHDEEETSTSHTIEPRHLLLPELKGRKGKIHDASPLPTPKSTGCRIFQGSGSEGNIVVF